MVSTRLHDQGESCLCWDYASTSSLRKSLKIKIGIGHEIINLLSNKLCLVSDTDSLQLSAQVKKQVEDLLSKGDSHQNLRKEIMFGLLPTTATGK